VRDWALLSMVAFGVGAAASMLVERFEMGVVLREVRVTLGLLVFLIMGLCLMPGLVVAAWT
jgi:hypothetical protein